MKVTNLPPRLTARFSDLSLLGKGGMGVVLRATDRALGRPVALKLITGAIGAKQRARFRREGQALASLDHPGVVRVFDLGEAGRTPYLVMELLEGAPLAGTPQDPAVLARLAEVARALDAVHAAGLVHRDVKPPNVVVTPTRGAVLIDFGLAMDPDTTRVTATGDLVGTLLYCAPEALRGGAAGPPADWYALGVTLYQLLEGRPPYSTPKLHAMARGDPLPAPRYRPDRSPALTRVIDLLLSETPGRRLQGRQALLELAEGRPSASVPAPAPAPEPGALASSSRLGPSATTADERPPARRWPRLLGAALPLLLLTILILAWQRGPGPVPLPTPETATSTARPQADAGLVLMANRVREELDDATFLGLGADGALISLEQAPGPDVNPLLDPDPELWPQRWPHLPELHALVLRAAERSAEGPLAPPSREALEQVDELLAREQLPRLMAPYLQRPSPAPVEVPAELQRRYHLPHRVEGWAATLVIRFQEGERLFRQLVDWFDRHEEAASGLSAAIRVGGLTGGGDDWHGKRRRLLLRYLEESFRRQLLPELRGGCAALRDILWAAGRTIRTRPELADAAGVMGFDYLSTNTPFLVMSTVHLPIPSLIVGEPDSPPAALVQGWLVRLKVQPLSRIGRDRQPDRVRAAFRNSFGRLEVAAREALSPAGRVRRSRAIQALLSRNNWEDVSEIPANFRRWLPVLQAMPAELRFHPLRVVISGLQRSGPGAASLLEIAEAEFRQAWEQLPPDQREPLNATVERVIQGKTLAQDL